MLVGGCFFGALSILTFLAMTVFSAPNAGSWIIGAVSLVFLPVGVLLAYDSFRLRYSVAVSPVGIWYLPSSQQPIHLAWSQVGDIRANDVMQWLVVRDVSGSRSFRVDYQVEDFSGLRDFILKRATAATRLHPESVTDFHRSWINKAGLLVFIAGAVLVFSEIRLNQFERLAFLIMLLLLIGALARDPVRLLITPGGVVITYIGWRQTIPFGTISGIAIQEVSYRGNKFQAVVINRQSGKPIKLFRFREGFIALHDALETAWRSSTTGKVDSGD